MSSTINNLQKLSQDLTQKHKDSGLLSEAKKKIERLEGEKYAAVTKIASLEKEIAEQGRLYDALRDENEDLHKMKSEAEERVQDLEDELSECVETKRQRDGEIRELEQKIDSLSGLQASLKRLNRKLHYIKTTLFT